MIDIYAIYTRNSTGTIKIQTIPAASQDQIYLLGPTVKVEMGNAESMDFSVQAGTPYYNAFIQMRTFIRVDYDGTTIFYGRVLTIDNGAFGSRKIHCEGAISLLNDTQFPGKPEKERYEQTIYEHMQDIISNHNSQVNDGLKRFALGEVPGHYSGASGEQRISNESREFGSTSWSDSKALLEDLKSHYGGHFRARYSGGTIYLDWMNHYFRSTVNSQTIEVGKNLIDISGTTEVNNIFTAIIPIGKKENTKENEDDKVYINYNGRNYLLIPEVCNFYSDGELNSGYHTASDYRNAINNYGLIFKTVEIQEGQTSDQLLTLAAKWIKDNYQGGVESFSVKAIDLRQIGENTQKILCGDRVRLNYVTGSTDTAGHRATSVLTCTSVTYDLFNPENNQYSFGIPANSLGKNYGVKNKTKSTKDKSTTANVPSGGYGGGGNSPTDPNEQWRNAVFAELKRHKTWFKSTGNVETGPEDRASMPNLQKIWHAHSSMTNGKTNYEVWIPNPPKYITGQSVVVNRVRAWDRDGLGRPLGHWEIGPESKLTITYLKNRYLFEYMVDEHGVDLTTDLEVDMPGSYTDEDGNITFNGLTPVYDPDTGEITRYTMATFGKFDSSTGVWDYYNGVEFGNFDPETNTFNFLKDDGKQGFISRQVDGDWHYYVIDPDDPTKLVEVISTRNIYQHEVHTDKCLGWVLNEDPITQELSYRNPGQMALQIEEFANGNLVVAYMAGELTYLGNLETQYLAQTSLNHMDSICGDFEYEEDPYGIKYVKINSGGGFRVQHGVLDKDNKFKRDSQGNVLQGEFGLFDSNTLKGGMIVQKINDTEGEDGNPYDVKIIGERVDIKASQMARIGIWTNEQFDAGVIIDRINEGKNADGKQVLGTRISLSADQVIAGNSYPNLKAWVESQGESIDETAGLLAEKITAYEGRFHTIETDYLKTSKLYSAIAALQSVSVAKLTSERGGIAVHSVDTTTYTQGGVDCYVPHAITALQIVHSGNNYTLQYKWFSSEDWRDAKNGTFSRAITSWTGSGWSGGTYTAKATPQNQSISTTLRLLSPTGDISKNGKSVSRRYNVQYGPDDEHTYNTGFSQSVSIDASSVYTDGQNNVKNNMTTLNYSTSSNGSVTYTREGGYNKVVISVSVPTPSPSIDIPTSGIDTAWSDPGGTILNNLKGAINEAKSNKMWVKFVVKAGNSSKQYKMDFR